MNYQDEMVNAHIEHGMDNNIHLLVPFLSNATHYFNGRFKRNLPQSCCPSGSERLLLCFRLISYFSVIGHFIRFYSNYGGGFVEGLKLVAVRGGILNWPFHLGSCAGIWPLLVYSFNLKALLRQTDSTTTTNNPMQIIQLRYQGAAGALRLALSAEPEKNLHGSTKTSRINVFVSTRSVYHQPFGIQTRSCSRWMARLQ
jgi:hypothetical protein